MFYCDTVKVVTSLYVPCRGVLEADILRSTFPTVMAFGVVGVAETWEAELLYKSNSSTEDRNCCYSRPNILCIYLADERALNWLVELRADERAEPVLLAAGEGGGGRPAWENNS